MSGSTLFTPTGIASLAATTVSSTVAFPTVGGAQVLTLMVLNAGPSIAFVTTGNNTVVATLEDTPVPIGLPVAIPQSLDTNIAAITPAGPANLTLISGTGTPVIVFSAGTSIMPFSPVSEPVATGLVLTGTTQLTALPLTAGTNVIASAPSGTGGILSVSVEFEGDIAVDNFDAAHAAQIYPPVGASINTLGINQPYIMAPNGPRITFSTNDPTSQWWAA